MTCIVGIIDKIHDIVVIGGDSAGSNDSNINIRKDPKVFKNGDFIFGCTTSYRMIQLLRFKLNLPLLEHIHVDLFEYMCTDFIDSVRECFKDNGFMQSHKHGDDMGGSFLVGISNRLFEVQEDFSICELDHDYNSVGSGYMYALGALYALNYSCKWATTEMIKMALAAAADNNPNVREPFIILQTENKS